MQPLLDGTNLLPTYLKKITNNKTVNTKFSWEKRNGTFNDMQDRRKSALELVKYVRQTRIKGEEITLIRHSHGGNVAIQAAKIFYEQTGESVNVITIATPTYESKKTEMAEDPNTSLGKKAINDHIHIYNSVDGVQGKLAGRKTYDNNKTKNIKIDVSSIYGKSEWVDAHSFDVDNPQLIEKQMKDVKLKPVIK